MERINDFWMEGDRVVKYLGDGRNLVFPEGVKWIGRSAFLRDITPVDFWPEGIELPEGLEGVDDHAFLGCDRLRKVVFPKGLRYIGVQAFSQCGFYGEILLPEGLEEIDDGAFNFNEYITAVKFPESLRKIGRTAFMSCRKIESVHIPASVCEIGSFAFAHCRGIKQFTVSENNPQFKGEGPFLLSKDGTRLLFAPGAEGCVVIPEGVTEIDTAAFIDNKKITEIVFPDSLKEIKDKAFMDCNALTKLVFPKNLKSIGYQAFCSCEKLEHAEFPEGLEKLAELAFIRCPLRDVKLPRSLRILERFALDFSRIKGFSVDLKNPYIREQDGFLLADGGSRLVTADRAIKNAVIPEGVRVIDGDAFRDTGVESVVFPTTLEKIGYGAFGCGRLKKLCFLGTPKEITENVFYYTPVKEVKRPKGNSAFWHKAFFNWRNIKWKTF